MQKPKSSTFFYSPFYLLLLLLTGIFWLIVTCVPYRGLLCLGKWLGLLIFRYDHRGKKIAAINLKLCFPKFSEKEREKLLRDTYISLGIAVFESALAWWGSQSKLRPLSHIHGMDHLQQALQEGRGAFVIGAHFSTLEIIGRLSTFSFDMAVVYRQHKKPWIHRFLSNRRKKHYPMTIERNEVRRMIKALRQGKVLWYTPDIDAGYFDHVFVPFFGVQAASLTAPIRLAKLTRAPVLLSSYYRREDGTGYDMVISPPLKNFPSDDEHVDVARIHRGIEEAIRQRPEQYIWIYKRFKTRPPGEARFYDNPSSINTNASHTGQKT